MASGFWPEPKDIDRSPVSLAVACFDLHDASAHDNTSVSSFATRRLYICWIYKRLLPSANLGRPLDCLPDPHFIMIMSSSPAWLPGDSQDNGQDTQVG